MDSLGRASGNDVIHYVRMSYIIEQLYIYTYIHMDTVRHGTSNFFHEHRYHYDCYHYNYEQKALVERLKNASILSFVLIRSGVSIKRAASIT